MAEWVVLGVMALIVLRGITKGVDVYAALLRGGKQGVEATLGVLPALCVMMALLAALNASGMNEALSRVMAPLLQVLNLPQETAPLLLLRPLSGSGSLSAMQQVFTQCGVDSRAGRVAAVLMSSSETIFYTLTVYLGATNIRKLPWVLPVSLASYLVGAAVCGIML